LLAQTLGALEAAIVKALRRARHSGELPPGRSPRALARALTNALIGLAVTGKLGQSKAAMDDIYTGTLAILG
jgi:TetR/AcrR family transcriptional repressor of nem operon